MTDNVVLPAGSPLAGSRAKGAKGAKGAMGTVYGTLSPPRI